MIHLCDIEIFSYLSFRQFRFLKNEAILLLMMILFFICHNIAQNKTKQNKLFFNNRLNQMTRIKVFFWYCFSKLSLEESHYYYLLSTFVTLLRMQHIVLHNLLWNKSFFYSSITLRNQKLTSWIYDDCKVFVRVFVGR